MKNFLKALLVFCFALSAAAEQPEWCKKLPRPAYAKLERVAITDNWFEVYKIRSGVFAIYEPHQFEEVISYLIPGSDRALLFDTGMGISNIKNVVAELTSLPVIVLNSHTHNDHVGDNWRFENIYAMDTDYTRNNARGSKDAAQAELAPGAICGTLPKGFDAKDYSTEPFHISHWVHDGDTIALGGRTLKVIATPGHTPDAIALLDEKNGLLFTGDSFYLGPIYLFVPETDLNAYVASMGKLAALQSRLQLLLPSHNVPVADPGYLSKVETAIQQVLRGEVKPVPQGGKTEYVFTDFSFLMDPHANMHR
jgi:glyoxylase-like metal-dependent hydrolase (beta-lactamase superfamily II)